MKAFAVFAKLAFAILAFLKMIVLPSAYSVMRRLSLHVIKPTNMVSCISMRKRLCVHLWHHL